MEIFERIRQILLKIVLILLNIRQILLKIRSQKYAFVQPSQV